MRADKGGPSLGVPLEEGDLDGEQSGNSKAQLRDLGMDNLDKRGLMGCGRSVVMWIKNYPYICCFEEKN